MISIVVKRHPDHGNPYKGKHLVGLGWLTYPSEDQFIIIVVGYGGMLGDTVLEK